MRTIGLLVCKETKEVHYACPHCEKEYISKTALDKHLAEKHPEQSYE